MPVVVTYKERELKRAAVDDFDWQKFEADIEAYRMAAIRLQIGDNGSGFLAVRPEGWRKPYYLFPVSQEIFAQYSDDPVELVGELVVSDYLTVDLVPSEIALEIFGAAVEYRNRLVNQYDSLAAQDLHELKEALEKQVEKVQLTLDPNNPVALWLQSLGYGQVEQEVTGTIGKFRITTFVFVPEVDVDFEQMSLDVENAFDEIIAYGQELQASLSMSYGDGKLVGFYDRRSNRVVIDLIMTSAEVAAAEQLFD